jgi:hypothetical protein
MFQGAWDCKHETCAKIQTLIQLSGASANLMGSDCHRMPHVDGRRTINVHTDVITMESDSCSNDRHVEVCGLVQ